jgi:hypothetical protein
MFYPTRDNGQFESLRHTFLIVNSGPRSCIWAIRHYESSHSFVSVSRFVHSEFQQET